MNASLTSQTQSATIFINLFVGGVVKSPHQRMKAGLQYPLSVLIFVGPVLHKCLLIMGLCFVSVGTKGQWALMEQKDWVSKGGEFGRLENRIMQEVLLLVVGDPMRLLNSYTWK